MGNLLMVIGLLMPHLESAKNQLPGPAVEPKPALEKPLQIAKIALGMNEEELIAALGQPSHVDHVTSLYTGREFDRYFYENAPCLYHFQSCSIEVENGKVASFRDVKRSFIDSSPKQALVTSRE
jgi:hypothetical protein